MYLVRTALAVGALTLSVPAFGQDSRYGWDRSRVERGRDNDGGRSGSRDGARSGGNRGENRTERRSEDRSSDRGTPRVEVTVPRHDDGWRNGRYGSPPAGRWERREPLRVEVRVPVFGRLERHDPRVDSRYGGYGARVAYRYGDRDFRDRDRFTVTAWFRALSPARLAVYGYYDGGWHGEQYAFRPGLMLSWSVMARLNVLPYEVEYDLGELPWYLERRIYGNTVLVIDMRTRVVVDVFDIDY